ncbi:MAG: hypothetical protein Q9203_002810 [Teloschistes exilis]
MPGRMFSFGFRNPFRADGWRCHPIPWPWWDDLVFEPEAPLCQDWIRCQIHHWKMRLANRSVRSVLQTVSLVEDKVERNATNFDHPTPAANFLVPSPPGVQEAHAPWPAMTAASAHPTAEVLRQWERMWFFFFVFVFCFLFIGFLLLGLNNWIAARRRCGGKGTHGGDNGGENGGDDGSSGGPNRRQRRAADKAARKEQKARRGGRCGGRGNGTGSNGDDNALPVILERTTLPPFSWFLPSTRGNSPFALGPARRTTLSSGTRGRPCSTSLDDEQASQVLDGGRSESSAQGNNTIDDASQGSTNADPTAHALLPAVTSDEVGQSQQLMGPVSSTANEEQVATLQPASRPPPSGLTFHAVNVLLVLVWGLLWYHAYRCWGYGAEYANSTVTEPSRHTIEGLRSFCEMLVSLILRSWSQRISPGLSVLLGWFLLCLATIQRTVFEYLGSWSGLSGLLLLLLGLIVFFFKARHPQHLGQLFVFVLLIAINGFDITLQLGAAASHRLSHAQDDAAASQIKQDKTVQADPTIVKESDAHKKETEEETEKLQASDKEIEKSAKLPDTKRKSIEEMAPVFPDVPNIRLGTTGPLSDRDLLRKARLSKFQDQREAADVGKRQGRLKKSIALNKSAEETVPSNGTKAINLPGQLPSTTVKISAPEKQVESSKPTVSAQPASPAEVDNTPLHSQVTESKSDNDKLASESEKIESDNKEWKDSQATSTAAMDNELAQLPGFPASPKVDNDKLPKTKTESEKTDAGVKDEPVKVDAELEKLETKVKKVESQQKPSGYNDAPEEKATDTPQDKPKDGRPKSDVERFNSSFPHGWTTLATSSDGLRCGIHAIVLSMTCLGLDLVPTEQQLMDLYYHDVWVRAELEYALESGDNLRGQYLTGDQLSVILKVWGIYNGQDIMLGFVFDNAAPWLHGSVEEESNPIIVWIHNNGGDAQGSVNTLAEKISVQQKALGYSSTIRSRAATWHSRPRA